MSGGEKKKKSSRAQGWEEAKDEFYQESYPTEIEIEIERDPGKLATLLPSKQNRGTMATRRLHKNGKEKGTVKRKTANRSAANTVRRQSVNQENYVAMLPDLSENLSNEETTWEQIMMIKATPVSLSEKKEMMAKLKSATKLRLQGYDQFKWRWRKLKQQLHGRLEEMYSKFELWQDSLKSIEGHYGAGVVTYFQFIKWMIFLNIVIFLFLFLFVLLPTLTLDSSNEACTNSSQTFSYCYADQTEFRNSSTLTDILDFIQGTGWMEDTLIFFGMYDCYILVFPTEAKNRYYNLPFAYILVTISIFIFSLCCIVKSAARGFRERLLEGEGQYYQYCNLVFCGWDFCIRNEKSADLKHKALAFEIRSHLTEARMKNERGDGTKLFLRRLFINSLVLLVIAGSAALIYFAFSFSKTWLEDPDHQSPSLERLFFEYLPSITIVALNSTVPFLMRYLVMFEMYSPIVLVRMTLLRTVFLRLASLLVLIATLYTLVSCEAPTDQECSSSECQPLRCWETYVGQAIYKLVLLDFATHVVLTFFVNFPRMLIAKHINSKAAKIIGQQQFELPKHVLDVVYTQTLCWLGLYFAPMLPGIVAIELILLFYIKKFVCLVNSEHQSSTVNPASRSKSLFMAILLVGFVVAVVPVAVSIGEVSPSVLCGPFRGKKLVWDVVLAAFNTLPDDVRNIIFYLGTAGFAVPVFIILALALYYFYAVSEANKQMVTVLKNQLVLEGHDKQFLLNRLSAIVKQQEGKKQARSIPPPNPDFSSVTDNSNAS